MTVINCRHTSCKNNSENECQLDTIILVLGEKDLVCLQYEYGGF